jgi:hypothetical protein
MATTREAVYDEQISPLMAQIIAICKEHKIPMLADFDISGEEDDGLRCTTFLLDDEWNPPDEFNAAWCILRPKPVSFVAMAITTKKE